MKIDDGNKKILNKSGDFLLEQGIDDGGCA